MKIAWACLLLLVALALSVGARALDPLPFEADYVLESRGMLIGETHWKLESNDSGFVWVSSSEAAGVGLLLGENRIVERSEWRRVAETALPSRYRYERSGRRDKLVEIDFDWQAGVVYNTAGGGTWRMQIPTGTLDKLSYLLALMRDLGAGKRNVRYDIADGGKLKEYRLHVDGSDTLETSVGRLEALKVIRERPGSNRETIIWVAPALGFLPIRVERREADGQTVTMNIRSLRATAR